MKILIVEDDSTLLSFLARKLQSRGSEVVQTHFGDCALDLYEKNSPGEFVLSNPRVRRTPRIMSDGGFYGAERNPSNSASGSGDPNSPVGASGWCHHSGPANHCEQHHTGHEHDFHH
jgi:hypothetical protein